MTTTSTFVGFDENARVSSRYVMIISVIFINNGHGSKISSKTAAMSSTFRKGRYVMKIVSLINDSAHILSFLPLFV